MIEAHMKKVKRTKQNQKQKEKLERKTLEHF